MTDENETTEVQKVEINIEDYKKQRNVPLTGSVFP